MLANIFKTLVNCFKIPELKSRILFTILILLICRVVAIVPVPGTNGAALSEFFKEQAAKQEGAGLIGMYSLFTGGALERCAIGALGIMPYITATIIIQLMSAVVPRLSKLAREEGGRTKIVQYGRYLTVVLSIGQGFAMSAGWLNPGAIFPGFQGDLVLIENKIWYFVQTITVLTTGTLLLMWLGEQITDRGIGNGISLVITVGILSSLPITVQSAYDMFYPAGGVESSHSILDVIALIALLVAVVAGVVAVTQAQRKIPVQYAQRSVGRKVIPGGSSFMPLRVNYAGVMPVIFAQAILMFPEQLLGKLGAVWESDFLISIATMFQSGSVTYLLVYALMILFFSYFWVATQFNEIQISDDLKKHGGYIPGVRPGQATTNFLHNTMSRITLAGAVFLTVIAVIPIIMSNSMGIPMPVAQFFGGTSILITVGVMLDTMRQMESHLMMRHYDGFLQGRKGGKGPRLRGRI